VELEWVQEENYEWADLPVDSLGKPGFEMLPSSLTGITFQNSLSEDLMVANRVLLNGSGVAAGDIDGDGFIDLYFTSLDGPNVMYKNKGGFSFEDVTNQAGVSHKGYTSTGAVFVDVNGNGHLDLLVSSLSRENVLYLNDGEGHFKRSENSGLGPSNGSTTMTLADIDGDSDLDLYIANYKKRTAKDEFDINELSKRNMVKGDSIIPPYNEYYTLLDREGMSQLRETGEKDELYLNNGDGSFKRISDLENRFFDQNNSPKGLERDFGLTAKFGDLNGDGFPDLYVSNDFWTPDRIWINRGDGTFRAMDTLAIRNSSYSSMAVDFSDINHDSFVDMFVVEMLSPKHELQLQQKVQEEPQYLQVGEYRNRPRYSRNSLYINRGDNTYAETSYYSGLQATDWSWAVRFLDLDLDGYEDVVISTGFAFDLQDLDTQKRVSQAVSQGKLEFSEYILRFPSLQQQNKIFRNNGDLTFTERSDEWGFTAEDISQGMAVADLDGDGDLEVIINRMNDEAAIYENTGSGDRIAVRLKGKSPNTQAVGAKLELQGGSAGRQSRQIISGGDYVSGSDLMVTFAADTGTNHSLTITWPDGTRSEIDSLRVNRVYQIDETVIEKQPFTDNKTQFPQALFRDASDQLDHTHHEELFNELSIQPLLPIQLSRLGPGIMWLDINSDGSDELLVGTGKGGNFSIFNRWANGEFELMDLGALTGRSSGDLSGIVGWKQGNKTHLVAGLSNYEIGTSRAPSALHAQLENGKLLESTQLPGELSVTGPLAAADYNGDGFVDLFVGGRFLPGQYPLDASSRLFLNKEGSLVLDRKNSELLKNLGLVTGALFVDYNNSGSQDLVVTTEWGTIRLFENSDGEFVERTSELGLDKYQGWWQGIASGDFNNDGYPDLVAANWGENSPYQVRSSDQPPLKMFYDDFTGNGNTGIIEAYYDHNVGGYVPRRHLDDYKANGDIFSDISSNKEFANSTLTELLGYDPNRLPSKQITTVQHMLFLNDLGKGFEAKSLPAEAQFSTAFDVSVADLDNDGHEDLFLSQNFFAVAKPQQTPRQDAGLGLWLRGDGKGNFESVPGHLSGVKIYGEQRGAALSDFTDDGRIDLAVSQNGAETRLFVNQADKRGIRIQLVGPAENELGIGSNIRLVYTDGSKGPRRNIQAGSGYWSQNSAIQIMGYQNQVEAIEVRWYDGSEQKVDIKPGQWRYEIYHPMVE
jgi:hypothetical protein